MGKKRLEETCECDSQTNLHAKSTSQPYPVNALLKQIPQTEKILNDPAIIELMKTCPPKVVNSITKSVINDVRQSVLDRCAKLSAEKSPSSDNSQESLLKGVGISALESSVSSISIVDEIITRTNDYMTPSLRRVINATGIIMHTNLGRSALAPSATQAVCDVARGYSTLEFNPKSMSRGSRHSHCEKLICELTGAPAAIAVNNNASAVMMILSAFAKGGEGIVSRGELVEIGGSFRIPDIMDFSGCTMVEVGTTNKTHLNDYKIAISDNTKMFLKVHPSNYQIQGFCQHVEIDELRKLADSVNSGRGFGDFECAANRTLGSANSDANNTAKSGTDGTANSGTKSTANEILVYEDLGSGALIDLEFIAKCQEPNVFTSLAKGCDLISFSGDKLLVGPQAGIIIGRRDLIEALKSHPLARVLRLDKMTLAALESTLRLYLDPERAKAEIPTLSMLCADAQEILARAQKLTDYLSKIANSTSISTSIQSGESYAGGGALPMVALNSYCVAVSFNRGNAGNCAAFIGNRAGTPVIARVHNDMLLFDTRTLISAEDEIAEISAAVNEYLAGC